MPGHLFWGPSKRLHGDLLQKSCQEVSPIHLAQSVLKSLYGDLVKRSCRRISYRYLGQMSCQKTSSRDLCRERSYRDLGQRSCQETSRGDLVPKPGEEPMDALCREPYTGILRSSFYREPLKEILRAIFCRDLYKGNLVSLLFTTRIALVLRACSHCWFGIILELLCRTLTTYCVGSLAGMIPIANMVLLLYFISCRLYKNISPRKFPPSSSANCMYGHARPSGVARSRLMRSGSQQNHSSSPSQSPSPSSVMDPSSQKRVWASSCSASSSLSSLTSSSCTSSSSTSSSSMFSSSTSRSATLSPSSLSSSSSSSSSSSPSSSS